MSSGQGIDAGARSAEYESYRRVASLTQSAFTLAEVEEAERAAREHAGRFPGAGGGEFMHGFHHIADAARERAEAARVLRLSAAEEVEREQMLRGSFHTLDLLGDPEAPAELARIAARLRAWLQRFPADPHACARLQDIEGEEGLVAAFWATSEAERVPAGVS